MNNLRVLVVDDSREMLLLMEQFVINQDCQARTCRDSWLAVEIAKEFAPQVIFLDLAMPGLDGYEVAEELRDLDLPEHLLVAITSHDDEAHRRECEVSGFDLFLAKPVSIDQIRSVIETAKERFLAERTPISRRRRSPEWPPSMNPAAEPTRQ
jgi:CheY-like chemotaxis protein